MEAVGDHAPRVDDRAVPAAVHHCRGHRLAVDEDEVGDVSHRQPRAVGDAVKPGRSRVEHRAATEDAIEPWVVTTASGASKRLEGVVLNAVLGDPVDWLPDQKALLCKLVTDARLPKEPTAPAGFPASSSSSRSKPASASPRS